MRKTSLNNLSPLCLAITSILVVQAANAEADMPTMTMQR